jgi:hypothetical protein
MTLLQAGSTHLNIPLRKRPIDDIVLDKRPLSHGWEGADVELLGRQK